MKKYSSLAWCATVLTVLCCNFNSQALADPNKPTTSKFEVVPLAPPSTGIGIVSQPNNTKDNSMAIPINTPVPFSNLAAPPPQTRAIAGGADYAGGYALTVLQKLIPYWQPPEGSHVIQFSLRLSSDGRPLYCEPLSATGNPTIDQSGCMAALKVGTFGAPPYGAVTEVFLSLATPPQVLLPHTPPPDPTPIPTAVDIALGNVPPIISTPPEAQQPIAPKPAPKPVSQSPNPSLSYAEQIIKNAKPYIVVPAGLNGSFTTELTLQISPAGIIDRLTITKPSGKKEVDEAVSEAVRTPGILPAPSGKSKTVRLTFTLTGN